MKNHLSDAFSITPTPGISWENDSEENRLDIVRKALSASPESVQLIILQFLKEKIEILEAKKDGQVIVRFLEAFGPQLRGTILLDLEEYLKGTVDQGVTVWLEPLGDRNSLRNLRGIEVKG